MPGENVMTEIILTILLIGGSCITTFKCWKVALHTLKASRSGDWSTIETLDDDHITGI
jgi:hypothetical protein